VIVYGGVAGMPEYKELEKFRSLASEIREHMASDERELMDKLLRVIEDAYRCAEGGDLDCVLDKHFSAGMQFAVIVPKIPLWYIQDLAVAVGGALGEAGKVLKEKIGRHEAALGGSHGSSPGVLGALVALAVTVATASIPIVLSLLTPLYSRPI
jgi:hypothetical protein